MSDSTELAEVASILKACDFFGLVSCLLSRAALLLVWYSLPPATLLPIRGCDRLFRLIGSDLAQWSKQAR